MDWQELRNKINRKMVEFRREHGKPADTLVLGKKEYAVLEANVKDGTLWSMNVRLDEDKDSYIELVGKKINFLKIVEYPFTPYRIKVEVVMPSKLKVPFVSFLDGQNASNVGVQIVGGGVEMNRTSWDNRRFLSKDLIYYQVSVKGPNKDMVYAWVNYLYEIEKAYTIELTCDVCGVKWIECRDTHYYNHLDGSKDLCKECKIHE